MLPACAKGFSGISGSDRNCGAGDGENEQRGVRYFVSRCNAQVFEMKNSVTAAFVLFCLRIYKKFLSPLMPPACRFTPTCSEYMYDAVSRYGALKGVALGLKRLVKCNPFCKGGYDPVR